MRAKPYVGRAATKDLSYFGRVWADEMSTTDPLASPLYGSFEGLPPTAVYIGSMDMLHPDQLLLRDRAIEANAPFTFVLCNAVHGWPASPFMPEAWAVRQELYRQLVGTDESAEPISSIPG
ncbi:MULTISPECIES: alpha/beta hydrolase [unclassified Mycobacterium]|uniref:alpha/beta hydrolase n=1 Tax=unclassified Mycobacterium TaxID=2642494 RepID=UPI0029C99BCE|nr:MULTISPECIES: alpha/beta hydrolase fold domain-containing protein [unclassified Mycobacterium]